MLRIILASTLALTTGCASIVSDSNYTVSIDAEEDQRYTIKNEKGHKVFKGKGTRSVVLSAGGGFNCMDYVISTDCGDTAIKAGVDGWIWGNILLGGIVGLIVDPMTGAACKLPDYASVLECDPIPPLAKKETM